MPLIIFVSFPKIFVPIHKGNHWCLAIINKKDKKFQYLDSLKGVDSQVLNVLVGSYLTEWRFYLMNFLENSYFQFLVYYYYRLMFHHEGMNYACNVTNVGEVLR